MAQSPLIPIYVKVPSSKQPLIDEFGKPDEKVLEMLLRESYESGHPKDARLRVTYARKKLVVGFVSTSADRSIYKLEEWYETLTGRKMVY